MRPAQKRFMAVLYVFIIIGASWGLAGWLSGDDLTTEQAVVAMPEPKETRTSGETLLRYFWHVWEDEDMLSEVCDVYATFGPEMTRDFFYDTFADTGWTPPTTEEVQAKFDAECIHEGR